MRYFIGLSFVYPCFDDVESYSIHAPYKPSHNQEALDVRDIQKLAVKRHLMNPAGKKIKFGRV
jgi:hypothetical protein